MEVLRTELEEFSESETEADHEMQKSKSSAAVSFDNNLLVPPDKKKKKPKNLLKDIEELEQTVTKFSLDENMKK